MKKLLVILTMLGLSFCLGNVFAQENGLLQKVSSLTDRLAFAVEGNVVGVAGETVYVDLGQEAGIVEGVKFEVVRLDKERPFKKGEKIIGYPETEVGEIEITKVRKEMSLARVTNRIMDIQEGDKAYQKMKKVTRVAITEFIYGEEFNDFTKNVQDILYTNLIQRGMTVVEREKLEQLLEEQKIGFTGMIDLATAARIGKMLGVEAVVVGTVADMGNSLDIRARLVDVEKGIAITAAQVGVVKNPTIIGLLDTGVRITAYDVVRPTPVKVDKEIPVESQIFQNERLEVKAASYEILEDGTIQFAFLFKNKLKTPQWIYLMDPEKRTYLVDSLGFRYFCHKSNLPLTRGEREDFPPGIGFRASFTFPPLRQGTRSVDFASKISLASSLFSHTEVYVVVKNIELAK